MSVIQVVALQSSLHWQNPEANRAAFAEKLQALPAHSVDVVVLPEMFTTGYSIASEDIAEPALGPTVDWMLHQARQLDAAITGTVATADEGGYYNRMYWVQPDGQVLHYDKRHLFRMASEHKHYRPGSRRVVVPWRGLRFCLQVCYDLRFPVFARNRGDYDVLIYSANWPTARIHLWRTLLQARAIENQSYVIGVNRVGEDARGHHYCGDSMIVDFLGHPLATLPANEEGQVHAALDPAALLKLRSAFPVALDADNFSLL